MQSTQATSSLRGPASKFTAIPTLVALPSNSSTRLCHRMPRRAAGVNNKAKSTPFAWQQRLCLVQARYEPLFRVFIAPAHRRGLLQTCENETVLPASYAPAATRRCT